MANKRADIEVKNFYGLNLSAYGDTQIYPGQSGNMYNCVINKDYNLAKANGYLQLMTQVANKSIQGMWYGKIGTTTYFLFAINGHLYKINDNHWTTNFDGTDVWSTKTTDLGTLTDSKTHFFAFNNKVYILNGSEYKSYDGTTLTDVTGYIPKTAIGCKPSTGTGVEYEPLNLLNGKQHITYHADGTATYQLPETLINSVDYVYVNGVLKTVTTHYTVNLTTGVVTFTAGNLPATGLDNVDIFWTKGTGNRELVYKNRFSYIYNDNRIFLYGNPDKKNEILFSPLANGVPSAEFFAEDNTISVGASNDYVTGLEISQNIMLVYKTNSTYYAEYDTLDLDGNTTVNFPIKIINRARGNVAMGQTQLLNNDPFTIDYQLIKWYPTTIENERNMDDYGYNIQKDLNNIVLSNCLTIDKQNTSEMWMSNGKKIWIYHYDLTNPYTKKKDIFSRMYIEDEPTCWLLINGSLFFGTTTGKIMKVDYAYKTYNGVSFDDDVVWEMNMYDFGASWKYKNLIKAYITSAPQQNGTLTAKYVTDNNASGTEETLTFDLTLFSNLRFSTMTFRTNINPQTKKIKVKAKKFKLIKLVLTKFTNVLGFTMQVEYGGDSK